jgi:hypothetical protein
MKTKPIIAILFIAVLFGCQQKEIPEEFIGVWETSSARYTDCSLEFDRNRLIFKNGLHHLNINYVSYVVTGVEQAADNKTLYHIYYQDVHGQEFKLSLYYIKTPKRAMIRFMHQDQIAWLKREGRPE